MTDKELDRLANKVVARMMKIKTMEDWFDQIRYSEPSHNKDFKDLDMTEEESAIGDIAKLMTLLNVYQEKEEYEKCAIVKRRIQIVNEILSKYK